MINGLIIKQKKKLHNISNWYKSEVTAQSVTLCFTGQFSVFISCLIISFLYDFKILNKLFNLNISLKILLKVEAKWPLNQVNQATRYFVCVEQSFRTCKFVNSSYKVMHKQYIISRLRMALLLLSKLPLPQCRTIFFVFLTVQKRCLNCSSSYGFRDKSISRFTILHVILTLFLSISKQMPI